MSLCGELWPDEKFEAKPITCHLDPDHGGLWHCWWHELHVKPGEDFADGMIAWHTELAKTLAVGLTPSVVKVAHPLVGPDGFMVTHELVPHPVHVTLHANMPPKPVRG
jgi:hypothetical protein